MKTVEIVVQRARWWMGLERFLRALAVTLTCTISAALALRIAERLALLTARWDIVWYWALGAAVVLAAAWAIFRRPTKLDAARAVDEGAGLKQALGTALSVERDESPWSRATVQQAQSLSQRVIVRQAIPLRLPRLLGAPALLALAFLILGFVPRVDLFARTPGKQAPPALPVAVEQAKQEVKAIEKKVEDALAKAGIDNKDDAATPDAKPPATPEEIQRTAVRKLTAMQDQVKQLQQSEQAQSLSSMKEKLEKLKPSGEGPLNALTKALQQGDFKQAKSELDALKQKLAEGSLSAEQKEALNDQLSKLGEQMSKLAQDRKEMEDKLAQLGLDKKLAANPEALKKALEQMKNLTPEQREALMKQAMKMAAGSKALGEMAKMCKNGSCAGKNDAGAMAALGQMGDQLSELELAQMQLASLDAAGKEMAAALASLGECMGQCQGMQGMPKFGGTRNGQGPGMGSSTAQEAGFKTDKVQAKSPTQQGPVIGSVPIEGEALKGEALQQFQQLVTAGEAAAAEAIENNEIPPELRDAVRHYFGRLKKRAGDAPDARPGAPAAPAEEKKPG